MTSTNILADISSLNDMDKKSILDYLTRHFSVSASQQGALISELRERKFSCGFHCRHCGSTSVVRYGKRDGRQRYKCKDCHKLSSDMTNTPMYRSKKANKWIPFIECMLKGLSLRETALEIGITHVTAFYWRHKVLPALAKESVGIFDNINNYHSRLKKWISRFNGVSTKYLQLYLVWFQFLDNRKMESDLSKKKQMLILASIHGTWETADKLRLRDYAF